MSGARIQVSGGVLLTGGIDMAFLSGGVCYATYSEAMAARFSGVSFLDYTAKPADYIYLYEQVAGQWYLNKYQVQSSVWSLSYSAPMPAVNFPDCVLVPQVFDPVLAASYWSFAMTFVLGCYLLTKNAGVILSAIRKF
jgi:hypothetical protein